MHIKPTVKYLVPNKNSNDSCFMTFSTQLWGTTVDSGQTLQADPLNPNPDMNGCSVEKVS
jgi:hypothetical protein